LPKCECVTVATFMCIPVYTVAAALAMLGDTVTDFVGSDS